MNQMRDAFSFFGSPIQLFMKSKKSREERAAEKAATATTAVEN